MTTKTHTFENALVQPGPIPTSLVPSRYLWVFGVREKWRQVKARGDSWEGTRKKEREKGTLFFLAPSHESARALSKLQSPLTLDHEQSPIFPQGSCRACETRARVKITPREKRRHAAGREKMIFLSPRRVSPFLACSDFHARSRFARFTISEEKWGTTRSLLSN